MFNTTTLTEYINTQIQQLISKRKTGTNSLLLIFAGLPVSCLENIQFEKLYDLPCELSLVFNDKSTKKTLYSKIVLQSSKNQVFWLSLLDSLVIEDSFLENLFEIVYIKCPYYHNAIPVSLLLVPDLEAKNDDIEDLSSEYSVPIFFEDEFHQAFDDKIGQIIRTNESIYMFLSKIINWQDIDTEFGNYEKIHPVKYISHTVTEDEGSWISLIEKISHLENTVGVNISISNTLYDNLWISMIEHLDSFCYNHLVINRNGQSSESLQFEYTKDILKKYWRKEDFRKFRIYKNVRTDQPIEIVEKSQSDVINDILTQVVNAKNGKPYRDVFVTAPTGTGKSVMFQIPAIHLHSLGKITLIISPLIALMNDQVDSLTEKTITIAATINSSISIVEKEEIIAKVKSGEVSILYLSPESLLSRSDIKMLTGDREIGLLVVDEAHIVTTWGKAFRPDYWYLGNYIQRLRKEQNFPIATFTATAIYKGPEDMFSETRDSLGMRDPITYFGFVPRKNISVSFQRSNKAEEAKNNEYNELKFAIVTERLEEFIKKGKKVLVYFPFVSLIADFCVYLSTRETIIKPENYSCYYGGMQSTDKYSNFVNFRTNISRIMLATKAFGMGIDIPDIDIVYHFAPTGNVCDYIQEIGRAARDEQIHGLAVFDYLKKDFSYVNRLHGISTLTLVQLIKVMRKILAIGEQNNFKRNLLVTSDAFQLVFDESNRKDEKEFSDLDAKVKTALLIIEKDYNQKMGFSPIVARPRALFTYAWFRPSNQHEIETINNVLAKYIKETDGLLKINLKQLWQDQYPNLSFAKFKYDFYNDQRKFGLKSEKSLIPLIIISYKKTQTKSAISRVGDLINTILDFCHINMQSGKYFKQQLLNEHLKKHLGIADNTFLKILSDSVIAFLSNWSRSIDSNSGRFLFYREDLGYRITNTGYSDIREFSDRIKISDEEKILHLDQTSSNRSFITKLFSILGLLEIAQLINFSVNGGENPEIFIRVNSYFILRKVCFGFEKYENRILENVRERHKTSVQFLDYLFNTIGNDTELFWDNIQNYFLGIMPDYEEEI